MRRFSKITLFSLFVGSLFLLSYPCYGQQFRFRHYGLEKNLPNQFIYSINQDDNGYLWLSTGAGLSKFNGLEFFNVAFPDSSSNRYATVSLKDRNGVLWFGCDDGTVYKIIDNIPVKIALDNTRTISQIAEKVDGTIWIIPQGEKVFSIDISQNDLVRSYPIDKNEVVFSGYINSSGELMIGTQDNILVYDANDKDSLILKQTFGGFDYAGVTAISELDNGIYVVGTNGSGIFRLETAGSQFFLSRYNDYPELDYLSVQSFYADKEKRLWISTYDSGVYLLTFTVSGMTISSLSLINKDAGLSGDNIRTVFQDYEENYWFGSAGDGLSMMNSLAYSQFSLGTTPETRNIIYIGQYGDKVFMGTPTGYFIFDPVRNSLSEFINLRQRVDNSDITSYYTDHQENIWFGTNGKGLYLTDKSNKVKMLYRSGNTSEDYITDIVIDDQRIWFGSLNGVIILDRQTCAFQKRYNIDNGLPHNNIENLLLIKDGTCAVAMKTDRLYTIDSSEGVSSESSLMYGTTINTILSYSYDSKGNVWAATSGNGVFAITGDSSTLYRKNTDMLFSDYCYSVYVDDLDRVWVGHDRGFSRYDIKSGIMRTYDSEYAGDGVCNKNAIYEDENHRLYIGTTQGFVLYDRSKDLVEPTTPKNNINYLTINDVVYPAKSIYTLPYQRQYVIKVNYVGINLKDPEKVYYQTRLVNWSDEWTSWSTETEAVFSPRDGHYTFEMNSVNEDELSSEIISFELIIKKPLWHTWWFILLSVCVITAVVVLIIKEREKKQKEIEEYLQNQLNVRTAEVNKQKEEIESQNIEITDSINYAKKIQTSVLPDFNKLLESFVDAFILFLPKDIVSGDFYWFDKIGDNKIVLVCADSTGHGVPGAFMSMIGTTLLQDIVTRQHVTKPSQILKLLDEQIFTTLNKNVEFGTTNDGMDIVVCEIDVASRHLRFSSAMRPVILNIGGEYLYLRGNRCSVGGESTREKIFDDQEYVLEAGDSLYLFSDGLPDQFGGDYNKKMKVAKLKKIIEDVSSLSMSGQKAVISKFFNEWKGDNDQVDDILLIGIKF